MQSLFLETRIMDMNRGAGSIYLCTINFRRLKKRVYVRLRECVGGEGEIERGGEIP